MNNTITFNYSNNAKGWNGCRFCTFTKYCLKLGDKIKFLSTEHGFYAVSISTEKAVKLYRGRTYYELAEKIIRDKDVMLEAAKSGGDVLTYASAKLKVDKDIVAAAAKTFMPLAA